jgi:hypothetical protein
MYYVEFNSTFITAEKVTTISLGRKIIFLPGETLWVQGKEIPNLGDFKASSERVNINQVPLVVKQGILFHLHRVDPSPA